jgi:hypothetical protein
MEWRHAGGGSVSTWPRPERATLIGLAVVVLVSGVLVAFGRDQLDEEPASEPVLACTEMVLTREEWSQWNRRAAQAWARSLSEPGAADTTVELAPNPTTALWRYRRTIAISARSLVVDGVYRPDLMDERKIEWAAGPGQPVVRRRVVVGGDAWEDGTPLQGWEHCLLLDDREPYPLNDFVVGFDPDDPTGDGECVADTCLLVLTPGASVRVRGGQEAVVAGETLTTYDVVGFEHRLKDPTRIRATMTVDRDRRLRAAQVWDTKSGEIYATFEAGPAPADHPPVVDPSGGPRFSDEPIPPPPTLGTVPPSAATVP